jgi:hypothetical protein
VDQLDTMRPGRVGWSELRFVLALHPPENGNRESARMVVHQLVVLGAQQDEVRSLATALIVEWIVAAWALSTVSHDVGHLPDQAHIASARVEDQGPSATGVGAPPS